MYMPHILAEAAKNQQPVSCNLNSKFPLNLKIKYQCLNAK
jgi:hypothetical protein